MCTSSCALLKFCLGIATALVALISIVAIIALISANSSGVTSRLMDLAIVTVMHSRHDLTREWVRSVSSFGLPIFASITAGDKVLASICDDFGVRFVEVPNDPLGAKHNAALALCPADRVMLLPSDDFVAPAWVEEVKTTDVPYLYPDRCGLWDVATDRACILSHGEHGIRRFGAGRVIRRDVLDAVGSLWTDEKGRGLDSDSHARVMAAGFTMTQRSIGAVPVVDVKAGENLWKFDRWCRGSAVRCSSEVVMQALRIECRDRLLRLYR